MSSKKLFSIDPYKAAQMAKIISEHSNCKRLKVGCLILSYGKEFIISSGFNRCKSCGDGPGECDTLGHAETVALMGLNKFSRKVMVCTHSPCRNCARIMVRSGVMRFYFIERFRDDEGLQILQRAGVEVIELGKDS